MRTLWDDGLDKVLSGHDLDRRARPRSRVEDLLSPARSRSDHRSRRCSERQSHLRPPVVQHRLPVVRRGPRGPRHPKVGALGDVLWHQHKAPAD